MTSSPAILALWITLIAAKLILLVVAGAAHASAGGGTNSLLLALGVSLLAEAAIVGPRALSTGLPFAADHQDSGRPGPAGYGRGSHHDHHHDHHDHGGRAGPS